MLHEHANIDLLDRVRSVSASLTSGHENLLDVTTTIYRALERGEVKFGFDLDGTLVHATPGDHVNVPEDAVLEKLLNDLNIITDGNSFILTGRPDEFVKRIFPRRQFIAGTEHGSVISLSASDRPANRIGSADQIARLHNAFHGAIASNPLLEGLQIEDYKTVTMTLGFTHVINPRGERTISPEMTDKMKRISAEIVTLSNQILSEFPQALGEENEMIAVDTVTPTNAVVEIMPRGACKSASLSYLRNSGLLKNMFTVFGGDSGGDKKVMDKVRNEGGICLGVGPKAPDSSHIVFEQPEHLRAFLKLFTDHPISQRKIQVHEQRALSL